MTVLNKPAVAGSLFFNRRLRCVADLRIVDDIVSCAHEYCAQPIGPNEGHKMNTLALNDVKISFDSETSVIEVTSYDDRLLHPVKLSVSANTKSYRSLLELLTSVHGENLIASPSSHRVDQVSAFAVDYEGSTSLTRLAIGSSWSHHIEIDLKGHVLIRGAAGTGKTVLMSNILRHGLATNGVKVHVIDFLDDGVSELEYFEPDELTRGGINGIRALESHAKEALRRLDKISASKVDDYRELHLEPIYVLIDNTESMLNISDTVGVAYREKVRAGIGAIVSASKAVDTGIYVVSNVQDAGLDCLAGNFDTRILMGVAKPHEASSFFGKSSRVGSAYLRERGRGVIQIDGEQTGFQGYFLPRS